MRIYETEIRSDLDSLGPDPLGPSPYEDKNSLCDSSKVRLVAVRRCENGAPSQYCYSFFSKNIQFLSAQSVPAYQAYELFNRIVAVPTEGTQTAFLWEALCDSAITTLDALDVKKLESSDSFIIPCVRDVVYSRRVSPPLPLAEEPYKKGYYRVEFPHDDAFDAFIVTDDDRVVFFKYTAKVNINDALCTSGFDKIAESLLKSPDANLVPFDCDGCPKPGAEWRLVWVVPDWEKAKKNVKAATFKPRTATFSELDDEGWEKNPLRCWDWASHIQQFVMGLNFFQGVLFRTSR
jgi:hypothetical protein